MLFILHKAGAIPEPIFEAVEGNRAGGAKVVMFSNSTSMSDTFYEILHDKRNFWHPIHIPPRGRRMWSRARSSSWALPRLNGWRSSPFLQAPAAKSVHASAVAKRRNERAVAQKGSENNGPENAGKLCGLVAGTGRPKGFPFEHPYQS